MAPRVSMALWPVVGILAGLAVDYLHGGLAIAAFIVGVLAAVPFLNSVKKSVYSGLAAGLAWSLILLALAEAIHYKVAESYELLERIAGLPSGMALGIVIVSSLLISATASAIASLISTSLKT